MSNNPKFKSFMNIALIEAKKSLIQGEVPIGAVIVKNNKIIASAHNQNILDYDPTSHAEIIAIRKACKKLKSNRLENCDLYVTLEPCSMCASAIIEARIKNLYYMLENEKYGDVENGAKIFINKNCNYKINIFNNIGDVDSYKSLLQNFFQNKRIQ
jgi:tRNA(Arg) A34 adenosine deaminase TadA